MKITIRYFLQIVQPYCGVKAAVAGWVNSDGDSDRGLAVFCEAFLTCSVFVSVQSGHPESDSLTTNKTLGQSPAPSTLFTV